MKRLMLALLLVIVLSVAACQPQCQTYEDSVCDDYGCVCWDIGR